MKPIVRTILNVLLIVAVWSAIVLYLVWASGVRRSWRGESARHVSHVKIEVLDSAEMNVITPAMVSAMLMQDSIDLIGLHPDSLDRLDVCDCISTNLFVCRPVCYTDMNGLCRITLHQRRPVARFATASGHNFYLSRDGYVLPFKPYAVRYVPVVTGEITFPFDADYAGPLDGALADDEKKSDENYNFLRKLINFVNYVENDALWRSEIVQINVVSADNGGIRSGRTIEAGVLRQPRIELVPRVGEHIVRMGTLDNYRDKLDRLATFYNEALSREGWQEVGTVDLSFDNQIVTTK